MTSQLDITFNLPPLEEKMEEKKSIFSDLDSFEKQLPLIIDPTNSDSEFDKLADIAMEGYDQLMDVGMNSPPGQAAPVFEAATKLLGHAITAKTAKIDKKLKLMDLELKRQRLALQKNEKNPDQAPIEGNARILDRNDLLNILKGK